LRNNPRPNLPVFVYGALKPGEISWLAIKDFCTAYVPASILGYEVKIVAGLPVAVRNSSSRTQGYVLKPLNRSELLGVINRIEFQSESDLQLYKWDTGHIEGTGQEVAILSLDKTHSHREVPLDESWSTLNDPYFGSAVPYIFQELRSLRLEANEGQAGINPNFNNLFLRTQAVYLLTWTLFERILRFTEPTSSNDHRIKTLVENAYCFDELEPKGNWVGAVNYTQPFDTRVRAQSLSHRQLITSEKAKSGFLTFYQLRNNIIHRGKSANPEFLELLLAAEKFNNVISFFLQDNCSAIKTAWNSAAETLDRTGIAFQIPS